MVNNTEHLADLGSWTEKYKRNGFELMGRAYLKSMDMSYFYRYRCFKCNSFFIIPSNRINFILNNHSILCKSIND